MTAFGLTARGKQILIDGLPADLGESPFEIISGGHAWLRYDALRIENATDAFGGVKTVFRWRGHDIAWIRTEGCRIEKNDILTLVGIEGRTRISLGD